MRYNRKWYYDSVKEEASKYKSRNEFAKGKRGAYNVALKNGWLDDFDWLVKPKKVKWDYDSVKEEASKYKSRGEFQKMCGYAYEVARINGWLDEWFVHSIKKLWDYDSTKEESKRYNTRNDFKKGSRGAYKAALRNGWLNDFDWLKDVRFDLFKDKIDCVYAYEFNELKSVYVGRTLMCLKKQRDRDHIFGKNDAVAIFAKQNDVPIPKPKILEQDLTIEEGSKREGYWLQRYIDNGWNALNRTRTGSIGGLGASKRKWNYDSIKEEAKKYNTRNGFKKGSKGAYNTAWRNGWMDDFFPKIK